MVSYRKIDFYDKWKRSSQWLKPGGPARTYAKWKLNSDKGTYWWVFGGPVPVSYTIVFNNLFLIACNILMMFRWYRNTKMKPTPKRSVITYNCGRQGWSRPAIDHEILKRQINHVHLIIDCNFLYKSVFVERTAFSSIVINERP